MFSRKVLGTATLMPIIIGSVGLVNLMHQPRFAPIAPWMLCSCLAPARVTEWRWWRCSRFCAARALPARDWRRLLKNDADQRAQAAKVLRDSQGRHRTLERLIFLRSVR